MKRAPVCLRFAPALLTMLVMLATGFSAEPVASKDQEIFNQGKILIFDKNWEGARAVFNRVIQDYPQSSLVPQAYYFIARCYQFQGQEKNAIRSYEDFIQRYPAEPVFPAEARNAVIELAASLLERGDTAYRDRLTAGLKDSRKEIRYFAAIRCSRLADKQISALSVPILREIVGKESESDLVDRARLGLLRLDPSALTPEKPPDRKPGKTSSASENRMFHIEVHERGSSKPKVELTVPMALAEFAIRALDEATKRELRKQGFDIDDTWQSFRKLGPMKILTLRDGQGNLVRIWVN